VADARKQSEWQSSCRPARQQRQAATPLHLPANRRLLLRLLLRQHALQVKPERLGAKVDRDGLVAAVEADGGVELRRVAHVGEGGAQLVAVFAAGGGCGSVPRDAVSVQPGRQGSRSNWTQLLHQKPPLPHPPPPKTHVKKISCRSRWIAAPTVSPAPNRGPYSSPLPLAA